MEIKINCLENEYEPDDEIYNKFNQSDKEEDAKYIEKLTSLLSENKIEYKVNKTDQGTEINY